MNEDFGNKIILIAKEKFGSQKKMATELGLSASTVSDWISGRRKPSLDVLADLCLKADISLDWLILGKTFETNSLDLDLYNEVVLYAIEFANEIKITVDGYYLMACYDFVSEEHKINTQEPIKNIFNRFKPIIKKLKN